MRGSFLFAPCWCVSVFMICSDMCAFVVILVMCVLYVCLGSNVSPNTVGCVSCL